MKSFLSNVHRCGSAVLKQNTDLAYYHVNQSFEGTSHCCKLDVGQVSDIVSTQANRPA